MRDVELRELRYFVAVATELNFSRAAERLGMAQSPLSKAIAQLESRLGARLLDRDTRRVELTPAGAVLLEQARLVLDAADAAITRTVRAARPEPRLTVTLKPGGDSDLLRRIIAAYSRPGLPAVDISFAGFGGPAGQLRSGAADVALLRSPFDTHGLEVWELSSEPRVVAMTATHRFAGRTRLRRADLAGEPLPHWPGGDPASNDYWHGRDPASRTSAWAEGGPGEPGPVGPTVGDLMQLLEVVAFGQAVAFVPASTAARYPRPDIAYIPVTDLSPSSTVIAWPEGSHSRAVAAFVTAAIEVAERHPAELAAGLAP
ncbi:LysR family transcriptional regulator [Nocardia acidivorans]|uniref:LysR family transcriptional regulator n=1 Tax=Nocardia acidivorans TaxID=404580 RepID=UPI00082DF01E|nr:LysR family transcriptional regulator [Nocardia acidivorans]